MKGSTPNAPVELVQLNYKAIASWINGIIPSKDVFGEDKLIKSLLDQSKRYFSLRGYIDSYISSERFSYANNVSM